MNDFTVVPNNSGDLQRVVDAIHNAQLSTTQLTELYFEVEAMLKQSLLKDHLDNG